MKKQFGAKKKARNGKLMAGYSYGGKNQDFGKA